MVNEGKHLDPDRRPSQSRSSAPRVRLSCETCRQRKIKCDKLSPCTNCQRLGALCIPVERARLPRGRTGRPTMDRAPESDRDLRERVSRIEQLLGDLAHIGNSAADKSPPVGGLPGMRPQKAETALPAGNPGIGSSQDSFFASSGMRTGDAESHAESTYLKDLLDQSRDLSSSVIHDLGSESQTSTDSPGYEMFIAGMANHDNASRSPSQIQKQLCHIYLEQVDPIFKTLHQPSLRSFMLDDEAYLDYKPGDPAPAALACAVCYVATCSLSEQQCFELFRMNKETMVSIHQKETEAALLRADFITSNDLTVLQAFALSLLASRTHDRSRRVWTMLGIAIRVAQALSIHLPSPPFEVRPFEDEMRKRLWHTIGALDTLLSLDHMSEPVLQPEWLQSHPPSNVNDSDISFDMEGPVRELSGMTDITSPLITLNCVCALRALNFSDFSQPAIKSMNMRQRAAMDFQTTVSRLLRGSQPDAVPFHWFINKTAECMISTVQLVTLRPMQKCSDFVPPRIRGDGVLKLAVHTLRSLHELHSDPRGLPWRMSDGSFAIWHTIAVAVSELRSCGDPALIERYWPFVEEAYEGFSSLPGSQRGAVWKAVSKFMAQGRMHRDELLSRNNQMPPPNIPSSLPLAFSRPNIPSSMAFAPKVTQQPDTMPNSIMTMPEAHNMIASNIIGPWPNVWAAMEFGNPNSSMDNVRDTSWSNYEGFIDDLYESAGPV